MSNFTEINTQQAAITRRPIALEARLENYIRECEQAIAIGGVAGGVRLSPLRVRAMSATMIRGYDEHGIELPSDCLQVHNVFGLTGEQADADESDGVGLAKILAGDSYSLEWRAAEVFFDFERRTIGGNWYTNAGDYIYASKYYKTAAIAYYKRLPALTADAGNWLWENTKLAYVFYVAARVMENAHDTKNAKMQYEKYDATIMQLNRTYSESTVRRGGRVSLRKSYPLGVAHPKYW